MTDDPPEMPAFVFERRRHVEQEAGFILAGQLIVDIPKGTKPKGRHKRMIAKIVQQLTAEAQSGHMPVDALVFGWRGGLKPPNAVDTHDDEMMSDWVESRSGGVSGPRRDSDGVAQMGLLKQNA
jgi:hypothetical protein